MGKEIVLVLGGGGAKGLAHIGTINALHELGYTIKEVVGTSIGALVGGIYCAGGLDALEKHMLGMSKTDYLRLVDITIGKEGWVKGDKLFEIIRKEIVADVEICDLDVAFTAVATDLKTHDAVALNSGSLFEAIRASISIPDFFTPVYKEDMKLVDGGILSPLPLEFVSNKDLPVIAVNLSGKPQTLNINEKKEKKRFPLISQLPLPSFKIASMDILISSFELMMMKICQQSILHYHPDFVVDVPWNSCLFHEFYKGKEQIELGYRLTLRRFDDKFNLVQ